MDNNEIIRRYEKLVSTIEKSDIYDGRWTYDLYKCESCGKEMVTTYADKGVTPFMIGCQCGGMMSHCKHSISFPITFRFTNGEGLH